jgi:hypothetical protein
MSVAYGVGSFVATDSENGLWSSPNGVQWTARSLPVKNGGSYSGGLQGMQFGGGRFLANYGNDILSSTDGLIWQLTPGALSPSTNSGYFDGSLLYGGNKFWALGNTYSNSISWFTEPTGVGLPEIATAPANLVVPSGSSVIIGVTATGTALIYQWYRGVSGDTSQLIAGATGATYNTGPLTLTTNFWVRVSNSGGIADSATATIGIAIGPVISTQPVSQTGTAGQTVSFTVAASGSPTPSYKWQMGSGATWQDLHDDTEWSGTTAATLTIAGWAVSALNGIQFRCVVTNSAGSVTSSSATLHAGLPTADFNGDGQSDIILRTSSSSQAGVWLMNGTTYQSLATLAGLPEGRVAGTGDFNGDGKPDLVIQSSVDNTVYLCLMNGSTLISSTVVAQIPEWRIVAVGDFDGDGQIDLVWQHPYYNTVAVWMMNGTALKSVTVLDPIAEWQVLGGGDFNGDGKMDLVWRHPVYGIVAILYMNGTSYVSSAVPGILPGKNLVGGGDFNHDGKQDLVWQDPTDGSVTVWLLDGATLTSSVVVAAPRG